MLLRMNFQLAFNLEVIIFILSLCLELFFCFNLDTATPVIHSGPNNSHFGFSLSGYRGLNTNWLIIGAPKAETSQPEITEGGYVYKCSPSQSNNCTKLIFDKDNNGNEQGNTYRQHPRSDSDQYQFDDKSYQMFGATIKSSRDKGGPVLACAPRYVWYDLQPTNQYIIGKCFAALDDLETVKSYTPLYSTDVNKKKNTGYIYGLAGMSAAIPTESGRDDFILGAPGTGHFKGTGIKLNFATDDATYTLLDDLDNLQYSYQGYSMDYIRMDDIVRYVIGAPRAKNLYGAVYVFPNYIRQSPLLEYEGDQFGAYFGQSLAVVDINGDGLDDFIVGAPFYANDKIWECGRIYIYLQERGNDFRKPVKITGQSVHSRFGYALAALDDINADGYKDFAVGAPYGGDDGSGVVYIYQGSVQDIKMIEPSQVITPNDLDQNMTSFGAALSGGIDVDDNGYPDVVVGAYQSDTAVLLRSRPVIKMTSSVESEPTGVDLDIKDLQLEGGTGVTSFKVKGCLRYTGIGLLDTQEFTVTMTLDPNQPGESRTVFMENELSEIQTSVTLNHGADYDCIEETAYIQTHIADKLTPIGISMTFSPNNKQIGSSLRPIIDQNAELPSSQVYFLNSCENNVCIPDLSIIAVSQLDTVTIGDKEGLAINITVENKGEKAFKSVLKSDLPSGFGLINVRQSKITDIFIDCGFDDNKLECDIGNPLPAKRKISMVLYLSVDDLNGDDDMLSLILTVESQNTENQTTRNDNNAQIDVKVKVAATIELKGISVPEQVTFSEDPPKDESKIIREEDIGPLLVHTYEVLNHGPSRVGVTEVEIQWPMKTTSGEYLFYLTEVTTNMGHICSVAGGVDPENLTASIPILNVHEEVSNRLTRDVALEVAEPIVSPSVIPLSECSEGSSCVNITCRTNTIIGTGSLVISLNSRLWLNTILKNNIKESFATSSAFARVLSMPYAIAPDVVRQSSQQITTDINPVIPTTDSGTVEIWIIILAIIGGLLLLLLIAAILYKVGFFKRKTIPNENETDGEAGDGGDDSDDGCKNGAF
ncbi:integrin alpha-8-like isoform X2 [Antedon mediterranea]|uniref:integrin alpha-8-like isoform X2 n=1 Tax=Antedon mediterranea TaxID=105859 RepID=UPI003AF60FE0